MLYKFTVSGTRSQSFKNVCIKGYRLVWNTYNPVTQFSVVLVFLFLITYVSFE